MIGKPRHFRPYKNIYVSACGIVNPEYASYDGRDTDCERCKHTEAWKRYMEVEEVGFLPATRRDGARKRQEVKPVEVEDILKAASLSMDDMKKCAEKLDRIMSKGKDLMDDMKKCYEKLDCIIHKED